MLPHLAFVLWGFAPPPLRVGTTPHAYGNACESTR